MLIVLQLLGSAWFVHSGVGGELLNYLLAIPAAVVLMLGVCCVWKAYAPLKIRRKTLHLSAADSQLDGLRVLHISDIHGRIGLIDKQRITDVVEMGQVDLVAVTGDLVCKYFPNLKEPLEFLRELTHHIPVFYVPGNHDYWAAEAHELRDQIEATGARALFNQHSQLTFQSEGKKRQITLVGIEDPYTDRADLVTAAEGVDASTSLLLAHSPGIFAQAAERSFPLVLCGHTHGGQVRVPLLGAPYIPGQSGLFPRYDWGLFHCRSSQMFISAGIGSSKLPIRFGTAAEVWLFTLRAEGGDESSRESC